MNELIFDRTLKDVQNLTAKGYYNASDLNRVDEWSNYLKERLEQLGYIPYGESVLIEYCSMAETYAISDIITINDLDRIRNNIVFLRESYTTFVDTPPIPVTLDYIDWIKANSIEKILFDINILIDNMIANFRYSNTFYSGEVGL